MLLIPLILGPAAAGACVLMHLVLTLVLVILFEKGFFPAGALVAFVPVFGRTIWRLKVPPATIRALAWRKVAVAILFTGITVAAFLGPAVAE